jgi:hypothetical protein
MKKAITVEAEHRTVQVREKLNYAIDMHILDGMKLPVLETQEYGIRIKIHGAKVSWLDVSRVIDEALTDALNRLNGMYAKKSYLHKTLIYTPKPENRYANPEKKTTRR